MLLFHYLKQVAKLITQFLPGCLDRLNILPNFTLNVIIFKVKFGKMFNLIAWDFGDSRLKHCIENKFNHIWDIIQGCIMSSAGLSA